MDPEPNNFPTLAPVRLHSGRPRPADRKVACASVMEPPPDKNYNALYDWCKERLLQLRSKTPEQLHATAPVYTIDAIFILGSLLRSSIDQSLVKPCQVVVDAARSAAERGEDVGAVYKESLAQHDAQWEGLVSWFMGETSRESFMVRSLATLPYCQVGQPPRIHAGY